MEHIEKEHCCKTHEEWLAKAHYYCPCGHVQWTHYPNGRCGHYPCSCEGYAGEPKPLTWEELHRPRN
jgi:hypothetical protein